MTLNISNEELEKILQENGMSIKKAIATAFVNNKAAKETPEIIKRVIYDEINRYRIG
ncbi:hypothetical protein [Peribacillus deserti]|uniref:hypothetical protein n=1 Tax=Peribacillus deserti TaxID=673318 RepID=UPI0015E0D4BE|nr:hypothetical protein [Peribacillus deserti]